MYGRAGRRTDHPIQNGPPASQVRTRERLHARCRPGRGRWFYVEGESRVTSGGVRALRRPLLPCQAGRLSVTGGAQVPSVGPRFRNGGSRPSQPWFLLSSGRRAASLVGSSRLSTVFGASSNGRARDPRDMRRAPVPGSFRAVLKNAREPHIAGMTEARGPFGPRHRWSLWIVGRWPVLIPRFPGGAAPREPPFVGVSAGSGPPTRGPYAAARQRPRGRSDGITCVRTGSEGLQWGQLDGRRRSPGTPGAVGAAGRLRVAPSGFTYIHSAPPGARGPGAVSPVCAVAGGAGAHQVLGIWLILPVVICLSQRLSHACLSISNLYGETANGSLNQLSFI